MRDGDVALGDRNEACETRLRGEEIVATGVEAAVGDAIPDRQQLPHRIEEKSEVHGVDHRPRTAGERGEPTDERIRTLEVVRGTYGRIATPVPDRRGLVRLRYDQVLDVRVARLPAGKDPDLAAASRACTTAINDLARQAGHAA